MTTPKKPAAEEPSNPAPTDGAPPRYGLANPPYYDETDIPIDAEIKPWSHPPVPKLVKWLNTAPGPGWVPYIVKCESFNEPFLAFRFQKDKWGWGNTVFTVNLTERRLVWRDSPSTLLHADHTPIKPGEIAFLFLTADLKDVARALYDDGHKDGTPQLREGPGTGGGGKWPNRAADLRVLRMIEIESSKLPPDEQKIIAKVLASVKLS